MGEPKEVPAADCPLAGLEQPSESPRATGSLRWTLPAAVAGLISLLLIAYGQFVQPLLLPGKYARHLTSASREYSAAVASENAGRTVAESLTLLRRTRLAHQRLTALRPDERHLQLEHAAFASSAAIDFERWLHRDRGYLRTDERERLRSVVYELYAETDRLLVGLLSQRDEVGDRAAKALVERLLLDPRAGGALDDLEAYAAARPEMTQLSASVVAVKVAATGTLLAAADTVGDGNAAPLAQLLPALDASDRELAAASQMMILLLTEPAVAHAKAQRRAVEELGPNAAWVDRVARLQVLCVAGEWNSFGRRLSDVLASAETAAEVEYLRRRIGDACMTALRSGLAEAVPAWGIASDRCQNLVLQLDSGRPDAAALIEPICRGNADRVPAVQVRSLSRSELSPLREVLKSLYLTFRSEADAAAIAAVAAGGDSAVQPLCQLSLHIASRSPAEAEPLEKLVQSLTEKRPDSGTAWYTLAILQAGLEDQKLASASLDRARAILGAVPAVEALQRRLEQNREAVQ